MPALHDSPITRIASIAAAFAVLAAGTAGGAWVQSANPASKAPGGMLLAPMIGIIEPCILSQTVAPEIPATLSEACAGPQGSGGALIEATLQTLEVNRQTKPLYSVGYTLPVPLLRLFASGPNGWEIDRDMVRRLVHTIRDVERPLILYLFSTHFAAYAPIEEDLARAPENIAHTRDGPLGTSTYYDDKIYNWTFATTQNSISERRAQAIQAVVAEICRLAPHDRDKIRGVTLLGELHQLFPDFQAGMGFDGSYRITDYSEVSVQAFRRFLREEFGNIEHLNRIVGSDYASFDELAPPSKDIRTEPLRRFTEHIDPFAHGTLPITGWAYIKDAPSANAPRIHIYRNGHLVGKTTAHLGRQDVLAAMPQFGDANTGWRLDLDFRHLPPGQHRLDIFLEARPGKLVQIGTRWIAIMGRSQETPRQQPQHPLPDSTAADATIQAHVDFPKNQSAYYHNPLASLWHAFRARQVTDYLHFVNRQLQGSCLESVPRYTHQIIPFTNPSWDENKFAIQDSLRRHEGLRLGASLYGEPTYGTSFARWFKYSGHQRYGVTEFHPLKAMDAPALASALEQHAQQGADFLSFFAEPRWEGHRVPRTHNLFSFDPQNSQSGSDALYRAVQEVLTAGTSGKKLSASQ